MVWLITWGLWSAVILMDWRRTPRDPHRLIPLAALVLLAIATRDSIREFDIRLAALSLLALAVLLAIGSAEALTRHRARRIERWAGDHGFEAVAAAPRWAADVLPEPLRRLPILGSGRAARVSRHLRRQDPDGTEVLVFDHSIRRPAAWYDLNGAEASGTVVAIRRPGLWLPQFQVRPAGLFNWMDGGPRGDFVPVATVPAFAKSYRLGGHEPRNLRALFADTLLARIAERPGWLIEGEGEWVAAFLYDRVEAGMSLKPSALRVVMLEALEDHAREAYRVLTEVANRGARPAREAGAA